MEFTVKNDRDVEHLYRIDTLSVGGCFWASENDFAADYVGNVSQRDSWHSCRCSCTRTDQRILPLLCLRMECDC